MAGSFTQPSAGRNYDRGIVRVHQDGSMAVQVLIKDASGLVVDTFNLYLPNSGPVMNEGGQQIAGSTPTGVKTARDSFTSAIDSAIDTAAAAGKFNR